MGGRSLLIAAAMVAATALPAHAGAPVVTVTGAAGTWATLVVPSGATVRVTEVRTSARFNGPATGVFIRPLARPSAAPGDPQTVFSFYDGDRQRSYQPLVTMYE